MGRALFILGRSEAKPGKTGVEGEGGSRGPESTPRGGGTLILCRLLYTMQGIPFRVQEPPSGPRRRSSFWATDFGPLSGTDPLTPSPHSGIPSRAAMTKGK